MDWFQCRPRYPPGSDVAIQRTARLADAWVISPGWTPAVVEEKLHLYHTALQEYGRSSKVSETILRRDIHLAPTTHAARQEAATLFERGYRGFDADALKDSLIVGSPEDCVQYLERMQGLGITHVLFRPALHEQTHVMQTLRLLGTDVIPAFTD